MHSPHLSDIHLPELGAGAGLLLWGFRACAFGARRCCAVTTGYDRAFGEEGEETLEAVLAFTRAIGTEGARKIQLSAPGCGRMTKDEVSIACVFSAAQAWDEAARDAHLTWLLASEPRRALCERVTRIADAFAGHGLPVMAPASARAVPCGITPAFRVISGGRRAAS